MRPAPKPTTRGLDHRRTCAIDELPAPSTRKGTCMSFWTDGGEVLKIGGLPLVGMVVGARLAKSDAREGRRFKRRADTYVDLLAEAAHWREHSRGEEISERDDAAFKRMSASVEAFASGPVRRDWNHFRTQVSKALGHQYTVAAHEKSGLNRPATEAIVRSVEPRREALELAETAFLQLETRIRAELAEGGGRPRRWWSETGRHADN